MSADNYLVAQRMEDGWWVLEGWLSFQYEREKLLAKFLTEGEALAFIDAEMNERDDYGNPVEYGSSVRLTGTMKKCDEQCRKDHGERFDYVA